MFRSSVLARLLLGCYKETSRKIQERYVNVAS
jgi:hypothetical protein